MRGKKSSIVRERMVLMHSCLAIDVAKGKSMVSVNDVTIEDGHTLEQRVYNGKDAVIKICKIKRIRH